MDLQELIAWLKDFILGKPDGLDEIEQGTDEEEAETETKERAS